MYGGGYGESGRGPRLEEIGIVERVGLGSSESGQGQGLGQVLEQVLVQGSGYGLGDDNDMEGGGDDEDNEGGGDEGEEGAEEREMNVADGQGSGSGQDQGQEQDQEQEQGQEQDQGQEQEEGQEQGGQGQGQGQGGSSQRNYARRNIRHWTDIKKTTAADPKPLMCYHKVS